MERAAEAERLLLMGGGQAPTKKYKVTIVLNDVSASEFNRSAADVHSRTPCSINICT